MKRPQVEESSGSDYSNSDDEGQKESVISEFDSQEEIDVDFEFVKPCEIDYHGIKNLLNQLFAQDIQSLNDGELADIIISLKWGTVVKIDDQLDPYALITLLSSANPINCIKRVFEFIESKSSKLSSIIVGKHVGLIISDRLINMPPQLSPAMFKLLKQEVEEALKKKSLKKLDYLIYISKIFYQVASAESDSKGKSKSGKKLRKDEVFYHQAEDEFISEFASFSFDYELPLQQVSDSRRVFTDDGIEGARRVFLLPYTSLPHLLAALEEKV